MTNWEKILISQEEFLRNLVLSNCTISKGKLVLCSDVDCTIGNCTLAEMCPCGEKKQIMLDWFSEEYEAKPTVRLTQIELDVLNYFKKEQIFRDIPFLAMLKTFGHFKDVDVDDSIGEIKERSVVVAAY